MLFKEWECLASSFNIQCLFHPAFLLFASPPPCVLSQNTIILMLFRVDVNQVFQIHNNRKLTDPHFQQKMWHISQSIVVSTYSLKCSDKTEFQTTAWCLQTKAPARSCAFVLRWRYCISRAYQVKYQSQWKWPNRYTANDWGSYLSLCTHKLIHKQCWHNPIVHLVLTGRVYCFRSFIYSDIHWSLSTQ